MASSIQHTEKIKDDNLRRLASEGADEPVGVLIELEIPSRHVSVQRMSRSGTTFSAPKSVELPSSEETEGIDKKVRQARVFLEGVLDTEPHWLQASGSFSARVLPDQLTQIAANPLIRAIWANRRLRV